MKTTGEQECKGGSEYTVYFCKIVKNKQKTLRESSNLFEKVCYEQKQKKGLSCTVSKTHKFHSCDGYLSR